MACAVMRNQEFRTSRGARLIKHLVRCEKAHPAAMRVRPPASTWPAPRPETGPSAHHPKRSLDRASGIRPRCRGWTITAAGRLPHQVRREKSCLTSRGGCVLVSFMPAALAASSLPARFAAAIDLLSRGVATSLPQNCGNAALALSAWTRLRRLLVRFAALVAALEAGRFSAPRRTPGASRRRCLGAPAIRLPGWSGWLLWLAPALETRIGRAHVESLLGDPDLQMLLVRAPQTGRILRPLCHMLGIETPAALRRQSRPRCRPDHPKGTDAGATGCDESSAREARPPVPPWLTPSASPPLTMRDDIPDVPKPHPARTGPPGN